MKSQKNIIKLKSTKSKHVYYSSRNKKGEKGDQKITVKKYDPRVREHVVYKEAKK